MTACLNQPVSLWNPEEAAKTALHAHQQADPAPTTPDSKESPEPRFKLVRGSVVDVQRTAEVHATLAALARNELPAAEAADRLGPRTKSVESAEAAAPPRDQLYPDASAERAIWLEILPQLTDDLGRIWRLRDCGSDCWVCYDEDADQYLLQSNRCHLRICPHCRLQLQKKNARRIREQVGEIGHHEWQFITLTMRHNTARLVQQLAQLRKAFRRLRQRKCWREAVDRGYAVIEIGWNAERQEWHPHLHVVAKTTFIDWSKLRADWRAVTGGSDQIDCRWVDDKDEAISYVCKYLGKPPDQSCLANLETAAEYYEGLYCGRFMIPFGNHPPLDPKPEDLETKPKPKRVCSLDALVTLANEGWRAAQVIWKRIKSDVAKDTAFQRRLQRAVYLRPGSTDPDPGGDTS